MEARLRRPGRSLPPLYLLLLLLQLQRKGRRQRAARRSVRQSLQLAGWTLEGET
jgi:hypothetical protein